MNDDVQQERQHREEMWSELVRQGGPKRTKAQLLRRLGIYGGAQGIWVDKDRTKAIAPSGVTVGLLHTGRHYADDLAEQGVVYHYPETARRYNRDQAEVAATKKAAELRLPVFVTTNFFSTSSPSPSVAAASTK